MNHNFKQIICLLICTLFISTLLPITASADTGPKASVRISFENMGDELCYGTLLSEQRSTGPYSAWDGNEEHMYFDRLEEIGISEELWSAFTYYEDSDGYYFLQEAIWQVNEKKELAWTYYPPKKFKILLYYPGTDKYAVSGICERYAFDTYYTVDMAGVDIGSVEYDENQSTNDRLNAYKSYQYKQEIISLIARIFITIVIEMCVALIFGFRGKKALVILAIINTVTQIILNILLNVINFRSGSQAFVMGYIGLELAVFAIEAMLYAILMRKLTGVAKSTRFYIVYALAANVASFCAGIIIANIIPGIF